MRTTVGRILWSVENIRWKKCPSVITSAFAGRLYAISCFWLVLFEIIALYLLRLLYSKLWNTKEVYCNAKANMTHRGELPRLERFLNWNTLLTRNLWAAYWKWGIKAYGHHGTTSANRLTRRLIHGPKVVYTKQTYAMERKKRTRWLFVRPAAVQIAYSLDYFFRLKQKQKRGTVSFWFVIYSFN